MLARMKYSNTTRFARWLAVALLGFVFGGCADDESAGDAVSVSDVEEISDAAGPGGADGTDTAAEPDATDEPDSGEGEAPDVPDTESDGTTGEDSREPTDVDVEDDVDPDSADPDASRRDVSDPDVTDPDTTDEPDVPDIPDKPLPTPVVFAIAGQSNAEGNAFLNGLREIAHAMPDHDEPLTDAERWAVRRAVFASQGVACAVNIDCFPDPSTCSSSPYTQPTADSVIDALRAGTANYRAFHSGFEHPTVTIRSSQFGFAGVQLEDLAGGFVNNSGCTESAETTNKTGPPLNPYTEEGVFPLGPGFGAQGSLESGKLFGPELSFGDVISQWYPTASLVKVAMGGSSLGDHWRPTGTLFQQLLADTDAALDDTGGEFGGLIWFQGFNDQFDDVYCQSLTPAYEANLYTFLEAFWAHYGEGVPVVIVKARNGGGLDAIQVAQQAVADSYPHVATVESADLSECFHYDSGAQIVIGERAAVAMAELMGAEPAGPCTSSWCFNESPCEADGDESCVAPLDCCETSTSAGCEAGPATEACVCALDSYCCTDFWDPLCVELVSSGCGLVCGGDPVCADGLCDIGAGETCETCAEDCGECGADSDCCEIHEGGSCTDPTVEACVCGVRPECCENDWDAACTALAAHACGAACPSCGDSVCSPDESCDVCLDDCGACGDAGNCCEDHATPGCTDPGCEALICGQDEFCCNVEWDGVCEDQANGLCDVCIGASPDCGNGACSGAETCGNCPEDCGPCAVGDCCGAEETPGCDDAGCQTQVCDIDPFCCESQWDSFCVALAAPTCGCGGPGGCGDGECDATTESCVTCPFDCGACPSPTNCCGPTTDTGCDDPECSAAVCEGDPYCCDFAWDFLCAEAAGITCLPCIENPEALCGDGTCFPFESCESCEADCGVCPDEFGCIPAGSSNCCEAKGSPGCSDPNCQETVCTADPFCCDNSWDGICANIAVNECPTCGEAGAPADCGDGVCDATQCENCENCAADCGACGDPTSACGDDVCDDGETCTNCAADCGACPTDNCCLEQPGPTCAANADCTAAVCSLDPFCCDSSWDNACGDCAAGGPGYDGIDCTSAAEPCDCTK